MSHTASPEPMDLARRLMARTRGEIAGPAPCSARIAADAYTCEARFAAERERLFLDRPLIIGHTSQIPDAGEAIVQDWLGLPLITLRDRDGHVGTFLNACRHRGMRLVQDPGHTCLRSLVCPYHQWTYGLDGALRNIPRDESFTDLDMAALGLVALPTEVRHGLIWVQGNRDLPMDLDTHLAGLGRDLDLFDMTGYRYFDQHVRTIECNWKLVQDAFLDGYHIVRLHRNTVGPFFPDAVTETDDLGDHIRSAVARKELETVAGQSDVQPDLRQHVTFSYTVFPNAVLIMHPDYTSIISLFPQNPHHTIFAHTMLTPQAVSGEAEQAHYRRSFELVDQGVFQGGGYLRLRGRPPEPAQRGHPGGAVRRPGGIGSALSPQRGARPGASLVPALRISHRERWR